MRRPLCASAMAALGLIACVLAPRARSSATNRLIEAKDKASIQINIGHVNADGVYTGEFTTMALNKTSPVISWVRLHPLHGRGGWRLGPLVDEELR